MFRYHLLISFSTAAFAVVATATTSSSSNSDSISSTFPIIDYVSDDEYPMIQRPIQTGTIKLTDSTTTSSSSSSISSPFTKQNTGYGTGAGTGTGSLKEGRGLNTQQSNNGNIQLSNLWTMGDEPIIDYSENEFDGTNRLRLGFTTSDMIEESMFTSSWWTTDCKAGGNKIETEGVGYRVIYTSNTDAPGDGTGTRMWYVAFEAAPTLLAQGGNEVDEPNSKIYKEYYEDGSKYGMAEVCVRVSLQTPAGIEVNYMESILTIHYYFSNGFYILEDFQVKRPEAEVTGIDMGSIIRAYDCSTETTGTKSQGMVLRVCIEPMPAAVLDGFRMKAIEEFYYEKYSKEDPDAPPFRQDAVVDSKEVDNQLTVFTCVRGQEQCVIETMLMAIFYQTKGSVEGRGVATMQLGNFAGDVGETDRRRRTRSQRRLGGWNRNSRRSLQQQQQQQNPLLGADPSNLPENVSQEFNINFQVEENIAGQGLSKSSTATGYAFTSNSVGAAYGIIGLLMLNIVAVSMLVMQLPYFRGNRLYL